jgi:diacylglycerol kinase family enzyme
VNGRYFLFHVGIGFDAAVVEQVERRASFKRWAGHPLFVYAGFLTWFRKYDRTRPRFSLSTPGSSAVDGYFSIVLNTNPYTFLGSRRLEVAPEATFDRGLVAVTFKTLRFRTVMGAIISTLGSGKWSRHHPEIDRRVDLEECTARGYGPVPYQVDGDFLGEIEHLDLRHVRDCLDIIVP